jgi:hypothetical protein
VTTPDKNRVDAGETAPEGAGSSDESIGRPANWREGRYQQSGKPVDQSVNKPSEATAEPHDTVGTQTPPATGRDNAATRKPPQGQKPVTRKDYE